MDRPTSPASPLSGPCPVVVSMQQEEPALPDYGLRLAPSSLAKNNKKLQRESMAAVKRHMRRLDLLRRDAGEPSLFGLLWCDAEGHVSIGGSQAFLAASEDVRLRTAVRERYEDPAADLDSPLAFPDGLPPLAPDWLALPRVQTKALLRSTLRHLNGGRRVRYGEATQPDAWPPELRFADPSTAAALDPEGRSGGASLLYLLRFAIASLYANSGETVERLPLRPATESTSQTPSPSAAPSQAPTAASPSTHAEASDPATAEPSPSPALVEASSPASSDRDIFSPSPAQTPALSPTPALVSNSSAPCASPELAPLPNSYQVADETVERMLGVLRERHPDVGSLASPAAVASGTFDVSGGPQAVNIHCVDGHWTTSAVLNGRLRLYDSLKLRPKPQLYKLLAGLYQGRASPDGDVELDWVELPLQVGSTTCGWWAMTFATELAAGRDPALRTFPAEPELIRRLRGALLRGDLPRLSLNSLSRPAAASRIILVTDDCCGDFAKSERWVECERCGKWRHQTSGCTGLRGAALRRLNAANAPSFLCPDCSSPDQDY